MVLQGETDKPYLIGQVLYCSKLTPLCSREDSRQRSSNAFPAHPAIIRLWSFKQSGQYPLQYGSLKTLYQVCQPDKRAEVVLLHNLYICQFSIQVNGQNMDQPHEQIRRVTAFICPRYNSKLYIRVLVYIRPISESIIAFSIFTLSHSSPASFRRRDK